MKKPLMLLLISLVAMQSNAQEEICDCYAKVKTVDRQDPGFQDCFNRHKEALKVHEKRGAELYKSGDRAKMKELVAQQNEWKSCYLPEMDEKPSKLSYQFTDAYGLINIMDFSVDFTDHNQFTDDAYITIDWADYDRAKSWKRPEGASSGSICIIKKQDSLAHPSDIKAGDYSVKRKDNEADWVFYINYNIKGQKYSGQFNGAMPSNDSKLTVISNNGRYIELEFSLITEEGHTLKGNIQAVYPFQSRG